MFRHLVAVAAAFALFASSPFLRDQTVFPGLQLVADCASASDNGGSGGSGGGHDGGGHDGGGHSGSGHDSSGHGSNSGPGARSGSSNDAAGHDSDDDGDSHSASDDGPNHDAGDDFGGAAGTEVEVEHGVTVVKPHSAS